MKKSLTTFLFVVGLALITAGTALAQGDNLYLHSRMATRTFNNRTGPATLASSSIGRSTLALAVKNDNDGTTAATVKTSVAILAGLLTLMLLQRRNHLDIILRPKH